MEELNSKVSQSIDDLINTIVNSKEYKICTELKEKMSTNKEILQLINDIKILQKKYIKSNYNEEFEQKLKEKGERLNEIPIYLLYNENLKAVNDMISIVNDGLNEYFSSKLNPEIEF